MTASAWARVAFNSMSGIGRGGTGVLKVDGKEVATQKMEHTLPLILQWDETFDIGSDTGTPVDDQDYQVPFTFTGKLNKLTIKIDRPQLSPEDIKKLEERRSGTTRSANNERRSVCIQIQERRGRLCRLGGDRRPYGLRRRPTPLTPRSRTSSSSWAMTSACGTSAPTIAA